MGIWDFLQLSGQDRTRALNRFMNEDVARYVFPELRSRLGLLGDMTPTAQMGDAMRDSGEMFAPGRTAGERFDSGVSMLTNTVGAVAPMAGAGKYGAKAADAVMDTVMGFAPMARGSADAVGDFAVDEGGALNLYRPRQYGERFEISGSDYFDPANPNAGRSRDPAMYTPYSQTRHVSAPSEYRVVGQDLGGLTPPRVVTPAELREQYDRMYFATGDRTSANRSIEEINDLMLRDPAVTYGGPEYMDTMRSWASEPTAMSAKANALREAPEGVRSLLSYMPMGERSGDFSRHMSDVYGQTIRSTLGSNSAQRIDVPAVDALIAAQFPKLKDVPSVGSDGFADWLSGQKGGTRAALIKAFDKADFKGAGMPDVAAVRFAVTNPDLVRSDALSVGYRMSQPDASGGIIRSSEHPSYGAYLPMAEKTDNMTLGYELPWWIGARDAALEKIAPGGKAAALPKDIKSFMGNPRIFQNLDRQWVDEATTYGELLERGGRGAADQYARGLLDTFWGQR